MRTEYKYLAMITAVSAIVFGLLLWIALFPSHPSQVSAQSSFEPFSKTFSLPASGSTQYIPACTTGSTGCIPNLKQVGHSVSYNFAAAHTNCSILLDGSNDDSIWQTIAADGNIAQSNTGTFAANGYFTFYRLKTNPCASILTLVYTGYGNSQPINPLGFPVVANIAAIAPLFNYASSPAVLQSFQCSNPAASAAFLQLYSTGAAPTLGTGFFFQIEIPPTTIFSYSGPPISLYSVNTTPGYNFLYAGAATTVGGGTAVSTAVNCNFQSQGTGPYYPFNPPSP